MSHDPEHVARAAAKRMYATDHAARSLGIHVIDVGPGRSVLGMTVRSTMVNGHDIGHGGMTFTLADTAMAYACNSYNQISVAHTTQITFLAPTYAGDVLRATASETAVRGRTGIYDVRVQNQKGETVAVFRGQTQNLKGKLVEDLPITREI
ncbi:hydroxyphenylacetyl-CoA thioesterase PaaI [Minwuia thermotolerans]|uniref:Phenylacetic acid degradation protein PaaD n=1 Tax=Minwuia thermotolerans TaxID=2056226 RepID=A0A2M9G3W4_9PROT|nr:hydroxyphenylacetyl-CoA thioesterase PaaI [Minwuia thermotolerans]PJK30374.1 phenylacetic acid degradation protein PaaD [Minwuia thermotolerans]